MRNDLRTQIHINLSRKGTDELTEIWKTNDRLEWTDTAFDVIREILAERLVELPPQGDPITGRESEEPKEIVRMSLAQVYFSFDGRIGVRTYWLLGILPIVLLGVVIGVIEGAIPEYSEYSGIATITWRLLLIWPCLALTVKRWHDRDKSGWWILIGLIPVLGLIWAFIETGFLRGTEGPNGFGTRSFWRHQPVV